MPKISGLLEIEVIEAISLPNLDFNPLKPKDKSDPYCIVELNGNNGYKRIGKTNVINDNCDPKWYYNGKVTLDNYEMKGIKFTVKDKDVIRSEVIGSRYVDSIEFSTPGKIYKGLVTLLSPKGNSAGSLRINILFTGTQSHINKGIFHFDKVKTVKEDSGVKEREFSFMHGMLDIKIKKALNLKNVDNSIFNLRKSNVSDPYVNIELQDLNNDSWKVGSTSVIDDNLNPEWNERFFINVCHEVKYLIFEIKDKDILTSDKIGYVKINSDEIIRKKKLKDIFIVYSEGKPSKKSTLSLSISYQTAKEISHSREVPNCAYPLRADNRVELYNDACSANHDGKGAWYDLYQSLLKARKYIYICGWSINVKVRLLRRENEDRRTLGEILLQKAEEGVQICILLWDELTSTGLTKSGFMSTYDEVTSEYFAGTKVLCAMVCRERKEKSLFSTKEKFTNFCFSHHQKAVVMDTMIGDSYQPIAFIGGLDLTKGRYDTPQHNLFRTLTTEHLTDFYNNLFTTSHKIGPRQPWHDIHCKVEGLIAYDIYSNFLERWKKQGINIYLHQAKSGRAENIHKDWNVQMFRSVNSDSAIFKCPNWPLGISIKKGRLFENSIHRAYIHHIRRSEKFIYLENQYFMGSSHAWLEDRDAGLTNLIPLEIVARIEDKIKKGERFTAYILIPMHPEGSPYDKTIQEILFWQFRTIEMMYKRIGRALEISGIGARPQDYLLFFCLGKREGGMMSKSPTSLDSYGSCAFKNRRLMIYIHSKLAIFDDDYIIIGSANINDRSLVGNRDTEIAIGAYQNTQFSFQNNVSNFRKALWLEHMGNSSPINEDPASLSCARKVKSIAEKGLNSYLNVDEFSGFCHLLIYPFEVSLDGSVAIRKDCPNIPDTTISFKGARSNIIPTKLTS